MDTGSNVSGLGLFRMRIWLFSQMQGGVVRAVGLHAACLFLKLPQVNGIIALLDAGKYRVQIWILHKRRD